MICNLPLADVYYEMVGAGMPVLMLHGYCPDHRLMSGCFEPVFESLSGWQRIYLDLPGMGRTPGRPEVDSSDRMLEVVEAFIERVIGNQPFLVCGESYGGYLARGLVYRRPEQVAGMLLLCPMLVAEHARRDLPEYTVLVRDDKFIESLSQPDRAEFEPMAVVQTQDVWLRFQNEIMPGVNMADMSFLEALQKHAYGFSFDPDALETPFKKPSLILTGRQDTSTGYRDAWPILEKYPRATFAVLDTAGHNLQIEQAGLFNALVAEWLRRVRRDLEV